MKLRLDSDDVLFLIQGMASAMLSRNPTITPLTALNTSHIAVQDYIGTSIEFVIPTSRGDDNVPTL